MIRSPSGRFIAKDGKADDGTVIAIFQSVVIKQHPFGEVGFALALYFDMKNYQGILSVDRANLNQFVSIALTNFAIADHFLEFLIQEFRWDSPVNVGFDRRKVKLHKCPKEQFNYKLPW
jgi:hypothetical protein